MPSQLPDTGGQPTVARAALLGLCPRCGAKTLFKGLADFAPACRQCGLDLSQFNVGDGPAAFLSPVVGTLMILLVLWSEFAFHPPVWVHFVIWPPVLVGAVIWGLRVSKAWLLQAEYWRKAREATGGDLGGGE